MAVGFAARQTPAPIEYLLRKAGPVHGTPCQAVIYVVHVFIRVARLKVINATDCLAATYDVWAAGFPQCYNLRANMPRAPEHPLRHPELPRQRFSSIVVEARTRCSLLYCRRLDGICGFWVVLRDSPCQGSSSGAFGGWSCLGPDCAVWVSQPPGADRDVRPARCNTQC